MDKKKILEMVFYFAGTFIVVTAFTIVLLNFFRDGKVFEKSLETVTVQENNKELAERTFVVPKTQEPAEEAADQQDDKKSEDAEKKEVIKIELRNHTDNEKLGEEIKSTLEASGYQVGDVVWKPDPNIVTRVIERNDKKAGEAIQKILGAGKLVRWPDPQSKYDVTVLIGEDIKP